MVSKADSSHLTSLFSSAEINPCDVPGVCHANASCKVENDKAVCTCNPGFVGDGVLKCDSEYNCCETFCEVRGMSVGWVSTPL